MAPIADTRAQTIIEMNVFLIENSIPIRERLKATIEELGGCVVGEGTVQDEILVDLKKAKPNIVIIDLSVVVGDGPAMLRRIKLVHPNIVIVIFTNYGNRQYQKVCLLSGADYFIDKSSDYWVLVNLLRSLKDALSRSIGGITSEA